MLRDRPITDARVHAIRLVPSTAGGIGAVLGGDHKNVGAQEQEPNADQEFHPVLHARAEIPQLDWFTGVWRSTILSSSTGPAHAH